METEARHFASSFQLVREPALVISFPLKRRWRTVESVARLLSQQCLVLVLMDASKTKPELWPKIRMPVTNYGKVLANLFSPSNPTQYILSVQEQLADRADAWRRWRRLRRRRWCRTGTERKAPPPGAASVRLRTSAMPFLSAPDPLAESRETKKRGRRGNQADGGKIWARGGGNRVYILLAISAPVLVGLSRRTIAWITTRR